jgi:hypothetical protein
MWKSECEHIAAIAKRIDSALSFSLSLNFPLLYALTDFGSRS